MSAKKMLMEIGTEKMVVELLWDQAPNICQKIWDNLPLETDAHMAKVCNHEFMIQLPFNAPRENMQTVIPGSLGWWDSRQNVNIWFDNPGPNGPLGLTALFGKIVTNIEGMHREGKKVWAKPGTRVKFSRICAEGGEE